MLAALVACCVLGASALINPGFEDATVLAGWKPYIYKDGRDSVLRADTAFFKEGRQSLCIEAEDPADVAVGQDLTLSPGSVWRLRCWIKTENLVARDKTNVGGLVDIQSGSASLARTNPRFGTSDWQQEEAVFRVPSTSTIHVALFFIGFGKGTGRVWFDGVTLEEVSMPDVQEVVIDTQQRAKRPVDLKQCGQFIEVLCDLIPAMIAQQVRNTSFEEEPPFHVAYKQETDKPHRPWYPDGAVHVGKYSLDTENPFNGKRAQKIECNASRCRAGISQDGFSIKEGVSYRLRLHVRGSGNVPVYASLHGGGGMVAGPVLLGRAGEAWQAVDILLPATRTLENATLTIEFEGPGTLWLDRVSLVGEDAVLGLWRPDVVDAIKAMNCGMIRFGGSTVNAYEWDQSIGPWDARAPFTTCWGGLEENFVGMEEFVQLCDHLGVEPLLCIRWHGKNPEDAAAQVEYFNGAPDTRGGKLRAQNGHADPYRVIYWQIGNEVGGPEYDASVKAFAEAMKHVDPRIKILSSYPSEETLARGVDYLDYLCPHHYGCADLGGKEADFRWLQTVIERDARGRDVRVAVTEWNTTAGDWGLGRGMLQTLSNALGCARYHNLMHRYAGLVEIAIRSNLVDSFGSGVIQTGPGWLYCAPTFYAQQLYARAAGTFPVALECKPSVPSNIQDLDLSATLSEDGNTLRIFAANIAAKPEIVKFRLSDPARAITQGRAHVLKDREEALCAEIMNTRDDPQRIATVEPPVEVSGNSFDFTFTPLSLTLLELQL